ncbi:putative clathrin assembly protein [Vitis vinifera]|uniref:Putative clathrin assembly protein n=1 Tax=Vitis vinifera TaxID=29760 RepID=A0A438GPM5_VITVI|nr:putative clathrin assembly protein [Vitis vinifera]
MFSILIASLILELRRGNVWRRDTEELEEGTWSHQGQHYCRLAKVNSDYKLGIVFCRNWTLPLLRPQIMLSAQQKKNTLEVGPTDPKWNYGNDMFCNGFQREKKSINMGLIINLFLFAAIFSAISATRPRADVAYCIHALARRLSKTHNWAVGP